MVKSAGLAGRLYPATPAGAIAARTLRYWRRDPRYLAGLGGLLVAPLVIMVTQVTGRNGSAGLAAFAPVLFALLVAVSIAQDLSFDGTAIWTHITAGIRGADDRAGRIMSVLTVTGPILVLLLVVSMVSSRRVDLAVLVVGLTVGLGLIGLGVGSLVGGIWQYPAPPAGANPFQRGSSGGLPSLLSFLLTTGGTVLLALPVIGIAVGSIWVSWLPYLTLGVAVVEGVVVLRLGIHFGGRLLDRRWPEVMAAVSEKSA